VVNGFTFSPSLAMYEIQMRCCCRYSITLVTELLLLLLPTWQSLNEVQRHFPNQFPSQFQGVVVSSEIEIFGACGNDNDDGHHIT